MILRVTFLVCFALVLACSVASEVPPRELQYYEDAGVYDGKYTKGTKDKGTKDKGTKGKPYPFSPVESPMKPSPVPETCPGTEPCPPGYECDCSTCPPETKPTPKPTPAPTTPPVTTPPVTTPPVTTPPVTTPPVTTPPVTTPPVTTPPVTTPPVTTPPVTTPPVTTPPVTTPPVTTPPVTTPPVTTPPVTTPPTTFTCSSPTDLGLVNPTCPGSTGTDKVCCLKPGMGTNAGMNVFDACATCPSCQSTGHLYDELCCSNDCGDDQLCCNVPPLLSSGSPSISCFGDENNPDPEECPCYVNRNVSPAAYVFCGSNEFCCSDTSDNDLSYCSTGGVCVPPPP